MVRLSRSIAGAAIALLYTCGVVSAATVSGPSGSVLVNKGAGFAAITADTEVAPGTQVMVQPGAVAVIAYGEGCSVRVSSGRVLTVQDKAPCANGNTEVDFTSRMNQSAAPGGGGDNNALLIGSAVVGGGLIIACIVEWCKDKSASP